jgi:hypothetical protein
MVRTALATGLVRNFHSSAIGLANAESDAAVFRRNPFP